MEYEKIQEGMLMHTPENEILRRQNDDPLCFCLASSAITHNALQKLRKRVIDNSEMGLGEYWLNGMAAIHLIEAAKHRGIHINVSSGKALADSLNRAVDENNPMLNRLLRMLTTRCMTQAVYFSAGTVPIQQYQHFGLACPIYTHFTSPIRRYADVIVHRLLAACIGADEIPPGLLSQANIQAISQNINYRHKNAQYAGRASVQLNVLTYFQGREETCDGFVMGVRTNGIQVFVPKYGVESIIVLQEGKGTTIDIDEGCVRHNEIVIKELDRVKVRIRLDESNIQHRRIALDLMEPSSLPGLSVDFNLSESIGIGI
ncbi:RNB-like protein [Dictyocaulus viviparus]|uniref:RNB-like protein n=1 Tax=Dictyocaulus viviparus TaxID=29172 RepID=A0A0D8XYT1_DICVI|nr:RNB-like protein [Dictyocaulus viviparus]